MNIKTRREITRISKEFVSGFSGSIPLNGSCWLIVDPMSAFLTALGYKHTLSQLKATAKTPMILILRFPDGSVLFPSGGDLEPLNPIFKNWLWLNKDLKPIEL